jgi:hypothetical protein
MNLQTLRQDIPAGLVVFLVTSWLNWAMTLASTSRLSLLLSSSCAGLA